MAWPCSALGCDKIRPHQAPSGLGDPGSGTGWQQWSLCVWASGVQGPMCAPVQPWGELWPFCQAGNRDLCIQEELSTRLASAWRGGGRGHEGKPLPSLVSQSHTTGLQVGGPPRPLLFQHRCRHADPWGNLLLQRSVVACGEWPLPLHSRAAWLPLPQLGYLGLGAPFPSDPPPVGPAACSAMAESSSLGGRCVLNMGVSTQGSGCPLPYGMVGLFA